MAFDELGKKDKNSLTIRGSIHSVLAPRVWGIQIYKLRGAGPDWMPRKEIFAIGKGGIKNRALTQKFKISN